MSQKHVRKWFHQLGPVNWYRQEWVRFEFELCGREFGILWLRQAHQIIWVFGGLIVARSDFNLPCCIKGGLRIVL